MAPCGASSAISTRRNCGNSSCAIAQCRSFASSDVAEGELTMLCSRHSAGSIRRKLLVAVGMIAGVGLVVFVLLMMTGGNLHEASPPMKSRNNLIQIVLAIHNYESTFGNLPPAAVRDKSGKPLLSWRLAIAPYLEADDVYRKIHFDESWDSPHNI